MQDASHTGFSSKNGVLIFCPNVGPKTLNLLRGVACCTRFVHLSPRTTDPQHKPRFTIRNVLHRESEAPKDDETDPPTLSSRVRIYRPHARKPDVHCCTFKTLIFIFESVRACASHAIHDGGGTSGPNIL